MIDFWNERYANNKYAYGLKPNEFFEAQLKSISKCKVLFPAEGEGRNAVYAAQLGFDVFAFDSSEEAQKKAIKLAEINKVNIDYRVFDIEELSYKENSFDIIVLIFAHFPSNFRKQYHEKLISYLKPNGYIIFEAFGKEQLRFNSGGPKQLEMLFSEEEIRIEFPNIKFISMETIEINLDEGPFHQGLGNVVRFVGTKSL
jgi:2-polyprenyl-3-methyl-5-hydroxy-6-metoxy-1,4-benzoquinol methylase